MILSFGSIIGGLCTFGRNIIITRLISVEDYGIAATFSITMTLIQMSTGLGVDRLIVQATDGNDPRLQATAHAFNILRGIVLALILYVVASPVANLFDLPEIVWAFQWLAVLPLISGFVHMDSARFQRNMRFAPLVLIDNVSQIIVLICAIPLALYLKDYRVMLWVITIQAVCTVILSYIFAERRFSVAFDKVYLRRIFSFGWPLMLNGLLMFGIFQADRSIVGIAYSMEDLGWFSAAFMLTLFPTMVLMSASQNLLTPMIAKYQQDPQELSNSAVVTTKAFLTIGVLIITGLGLAGPALSVVLFGEKYHEGAHFIPWLALMQGIRMVKAGPTTIAIAWGKTKQPMYTNLIRSIALPLSLLAVWYNWGVTGIILSGVLGELMATIFFIYLIRKSVGMSVSSLSVMLVVSIGLVVGALLLSMQFAKGTNPVFEIGIGIAYSLMALVICLFLSKDLIRWAKQASVHR